MDARKIYREKYSAILSRCIKYGSTMCHIEDDDIEKVKAFVSIDNSFEIKQDDMGYWLKHKVA